MIDIRNIEITHIQDYDKLLTFIKKTHITEDTVNELKHYIGLKCNRICVENPYADKDYLSTFYIHYSKKYKEYSKKCYRLHFFYNDYYYGYVTLRPTYLKKIGRTYIHPSLVLDGYAYLMLGTYKANLVGTRTMIDCFPWMQQETDISTCSHVALWSVLRYFGNKHNKYADMTMGEVSEKVQLNYDRKTPSKGLRAEQISNLLTQYNFSTLIRGKVGAKHYFDEMLSYIESGIPLIGVSDKSEHAMCIIGHGAVNTDFNNINILDYTEFEHVESNDDGRTKTDIILSTNFVESIIVNDDNYFPYRQVYRNIKEITKVEKYNPAYIIDDISYFIIPLYDKMQLTYNEVYNRVMSLLLHNNLRHLPSPKILRFFLASSNSFKEKSVDNILNIKLRNVILRLNLPKFVWCVEISSSNSFINGLVDGLIIIDSTCSSQDSEPWLLMHDNTTVKYFNGNRIVTYTDNDGIKPYNRYINNLEEIQYV